MFHAQEFPAKTSGGMERGKIIGTKAAAFEERDGQRVAHGHRHGGACRGREIQRTGLFLDAYVQHHVARFRQRGMKFASQKDDGHFQALERFEQANDLFGFAAIGDGQESISTGEHAQIAVQGFRSVQKKGWSAGAGKGGGNFSADETRLSHAGDDDAPFADEQDVHGFVEAGVQPREHVLNGLRFDLEHTPRGIKAHFALHRRTTVLSPFNFVSKLRSSDSGRALGPSESALAGLSWVSRKMPSTPAATPARASGSMNCGCPPLDWPCPPGSCTECVTSKTTG